MVMVIGQSTARAFGLVGLGAFMRFRTPVKDQRDAATMFVMIGLGMAAGRGMLAIGVLATAMFAVVVLVLDLASPPTARLKTVTFTVGDHDSCPLLLAAFPGARTLAIEHADGEPAELVLQIDTTADAAAILDLLERRRIPGIVGVAIDDDG
jgi:uncharacterized membrane protein YhiD involved in acid resistance